jgi:uncharacterized membrane protein
MSEVAETPDAGKIQFPAPAPILRWLMGVLALAAAGISGYLLFVSLATKGAPLGCGAGSGCETVLNSRWSNLLGVPVSAPAIAIYLAAIVAVAFACPRQIAIVRQAAWAALLIIAAAIAAGAVWFIGLQLFELEAICPWCMAAHGIGLALAAMIVCTAPLRRPGFGMAPTLGLFGLGLMLAGSMVAGQFVIGPAKEPLRRLAAGKNDDTGPGEERRLTVLDGRLELDAHNEPVLGSSNAPKLLVVLFDYCCPHCRAAHGYLREGLRRYAGQIGVLMLPSPLDARCNPAIEETEPRFKDACELARLALAVFLADKGKFAEYDSWLFEPESPRSAADARQEAERLVTREKLSAALARPEVNERIARNVKAYSDSGAETIPLIMSPGFDSIVGRPSSAEELFQALERGLELRQLTPTASAPRE